MNLFHVKVQITRPGHSRARFEGLRYEQRVFGVIFFWILRTDNQIAS